MDRGIWRAIVHGITKSWTQLSDEHTQWKYGIWGGDGGGQRCAELGVSGVSGWT